MHLSTLMNILFVDAYQYINQYLLCNINMHIEMLYIVRHLFMCTLCVCVCVHIMCVLCVHMSIVCNVHVCVCCVCKCILCVCVLCVHTYVHTYSRYVCARDEAILHMMH